MNLNTLKLNKTQNSGSETHESHFSNPTATGGSIAAQQLQWLLYLTAQGTFPSQSFLGSGAHTTVSIKY